MTPAELERARRAQALLNDPLLKAAFAAVEVDIWERIKNSELQQEALRQQLYCMIKGLELVAGALGAHVNQMKIETRQSGANTRP